MKKILFTTILLLLNLCFVIGQNVRFTAHLLKDSILSIEPIQIYYKITNNSEIKYELNTNIISPCFQPILEFRLMTNKKWQTLENSFNQNRGESYMICSEVSYEPTMDLDLTWSFSEHINYSVFNFKRQDGDINYTTVKPIFEENKAYEIRLKIFNAVSSNKIDTFYSNILRINTYNENMKDRKAKRWLLAKDKTVSIFNPIFDPIFLKPNKVYIYEFIKKYHKTKYVKYAELISAEILLEEAIQETDSGKLLDIEKYNKINFTLQKYNYLTKKDKGFKDFFERKNSQINWIDNQFKN